MYLKYSLLDFYTIHIWRTKKKRRLLLTSKNLFIKIKKWACQKFDKKDILLRFKNLSQNFQDLLKKLWQSYEQMNLWVISDDIRTTNQKKVQLRFSKISVLQQKKSNSYILQIWSWLLPVLNRRGRHWVPQWQCERSFLRKKINKNLIIEEKYIPQYAERALN